MRGVVSGQGLLVLLRVQIMRLGILLCMNECTAKELVVVNEIMVKLCVDTLSSFESSDEVRY